MPLGNAVTWINWAASGAMAAPQLSLDVLDLAQPEMEFDRFTTIAKDFGPGRGDAYSYSIVSDLGGPTTFTGNILGELGDIPVDDWTQTRNSISVYEVGRATAYSNQAKTLSAIDVEAICRGRLKNHIKRVMDAGAWSGFSAAQVIYSPTGATAGTFATSGTAGATVSHNLTAYHLRDMADYMYSTLKAEPWDEDGNYVLLSTRKAVRSVYDDPEFRKIASYADPKRYIRGEVGTYYRWRVVETNNSDVLPNIGTAGVCGGAIGFGKDAVRKVLVKAPLITMEPARHGRGAEFAWSGIMGYGQTFVNSTMGRDNKVILGSQ